MLAPLNKQVGRNKCTTDQIGRKTVIPALGEAHAKGYRRESKDLRWRTKSAINYVRLLSYINLN